MISSQRLIKPVGQSTWSLVKATFVRLTMDAKTPMHFTIVRPICHWWVECMRGNVVTTCFNLVYCCILCNVSFFELAHHLNHFEFAWFARCLPYLHHGSLSFQCFNHLPKGFKVFLTGFVLRPVYACCGSLDPFKAKINVQKYSGTCETVTKPYYNKLKLHQSLKTLL